MYSDTFDPTGNSGTGSVTSTRPDGVHAPGNKATATQSRMEEIIAGLEQPGAAISPKYFYDTRGSELFEQITRLPEYYPTRTERRIMEEFAAPMAGSVPPSSTVIELGAGNCEKALRLCETLRPSCFVAVDISDAFLHESVARLRRQLPSVDIRAVAADLAHHIELPADLPMRPRLVFYPGSSISNFDRPQALELLSRIRRLAGDDGALLIGVDLLKEVHIMEAAYNDSAGVTAAFNLNALSHVNQLVGSDFCAAHWRHHAFFNATESRIEMHLEATVETVVHWPGGERRFMRGERIHTENSYKYRREDFIELLARAGFSHAQTWHDEHRWFGVMLARP